MLPVQLDLGTLVIEDSLEDAPIITLQELARGSGHALVLDLETTGLNWWNGKDAIIGIAIYCPARNIAGYIPMYDSHDIEEAKRIIRSWDQDTVVIGHNIKFDLHFLGINPRQVPWKIYDTMLMAHILDSRGAPYVDGTWPDPHEERGTFNLGDLSRFYIRDESKIKTLQRMGRKKHHQWPLKDISRYAVEDARLTWELAQHLKVKLQKHGQFHLVERVMDFMSVIWNTERIGMRVDLDWLENLESVLGPDLERLENELFTHPRINQRFEWRSTAKLSHMLYDVYGHPRPENPFQGKGKFREAAYSSSSKTSSFLLVEKANHPLGALIVHMRGLDKLLQFCREWRDLLDSDGMIHGSFLQHGTRTARLSSRQPNLQQLPADVRSMIQTNSFTNVADLERFYASTNMRRSFVARPGYTFMSIDYRQQEIRLFARLSQDEALLGALQSGQDVHSEVAKRIWGKGIPPWREWAKVVSFGILYGMTAGSLEFRLNVARARAFEIMDEYYTAFPRVKGWMDDIIHQMATQGYTSYWSDRRYYRDTEVYFYKAVNALVQGGAADILMYACTDLQRWFEQQGIDGHFVNYVHDEAVLELPADLAEELAPIISEKMEMEHLLDIPFKTEVKIGDSLGTMKRVSDEGVDFDPKVAFRQMEEEEKTA